LPIVVNLKLFREFLSSTTRELARREVAPAHLPARDQLVVRASSIGKVPVAEAAVERLLRSRGLDQGCQDQSSRSFCLRLPERNNFRSALQEQNKVGRGGAFFLGLLLILVAVGAAGLQVQAVVSRWRDYGILQALGFTPGQVLLYHGLQFALVLTSGIAIAAIASLLLATISATSVIAAAGLAALAAGLASLPVLVWPLWRPAAEVLRETDALVIAPAAQDVPSVVDGLREAFRLEPAVFITEHYGQFRRKVDDFAQILALFTIIGAATAVLAGSFAANLLHDVYTDRRRQYAMLIAIGFSPMQSTMVGIGVGIAAASAGTLLGALAAAACTPRHFAMPSLMANLGTIEPRFNVLIAAVVVGMSLAAVALGVAPTAWWLHRRSVAGALSEEGR
jgi:ABC-type lipoprotein release transport system permease subunit